ncbi:dioxygenase 2OG-Fe(II) oxygenase superfamily protein [Mycolicibacterium canariasense]|uniref:Dioxygenase 2OG-Fe(II) oxygenase superfamily protein n=1 Tax=Mycolicibacterium canariasense TaxID=228230 RepID=A0A100WFZ7_MYCCR|nr:2OG-Fe(II) oxygenase family protein [Mycolicibacterium canariasense]MCV7209575.1 isopenicillin N synthase family oxygenase [Mycolicibacterium canariasense]ORU99508.1 2OG-Fe(II) oxygenase [Mycolicibacterium canariasense]GAS97587.1 dioxygenase 2OG-Fe(II) oxygenase superfamily protein [Mycolicibacterium canariasense]
MNDMTELLRERSMGALGTESMREVRRISLAGLPGRRSQIADELWSAATDIGFFQVVDHGIDLADVRNAFAAAERFFALPEEVKSRRPKRFNSGWEQLTQVRPSVGVPDQKESYQITLSNMDGLWPGEDELPGFRATMLDFERKCWALAMELLSLFADKLDFDRDFFTRAHDPASPTYQSTLRLLHYFALPADADLNGVWRAGAHTDFDCLTLLFQRDGQGGLQVCPGKEMAAQEWTSVQPSEEAITCNIGDMLMRWSDDQLPSNFHRVKSPGPDDHRGARYSIAFFAQANSEVTIAGPTAKYPPISAKDYLQQRISANFTR